MEHLYRKNTALVSIGDEDGRVLGASPNYMNWLGRDKAGVVGHFGREWTHPLDFERTWQKYKTAFSENRQISWSRKIIKTDGNTIVAQIIAKPHTLDCGKHVIICTSRSLPIDNLLNFSSIKFATEIANYVQDLSEQLAIMSQDCGLFSLSSILEQAVAEATEAAVRLSDAT